MPGQSGRVRRSSFWGGIDPADDLPVAGQPS
jgi:hypothetical protein